MSPPVPVPAEVPAEIPTEFIERRIFLIRGRKVMLDTDLAGLYGVRTKALNQAVRRNINRFPADFMFRLSNDEVDVLSRSQIVTSSGSKGTKILRSQIVTSRWGGQRYAPLAFTEQGVAMLSSVLKSKRAVQVNILIMRVFVKIRELMASHQELARRVDELEKQYGQQNRDIQAIFSAIRGLFQPPADEAENKDKPPMGF